MAIFVCSKRNILQCLESPFSHQEDGSSLAYLSYGQLRSHAQKLAGRLKQAGNGWEADSLMDRNG